MYHIESQPECYIEGANIKSMVYRDEKERKYPDLTKCNFCKTWLFFFFWVTLILFGSFMGS